MPLPDHERVARDHHGIVAGLSARRLATAALVVVVLCVVGFVAAVGSHWYETGDLFCLWHGARLSAAGKDPYRAATWLAATAGLYPDVRGGLRPSACPASYAYPLLTAVAMWPLGMLPLPLAAMAWMALAVGGAIAGTAWSWRAFGGTRRGAPLLAAAAFSSQPFWVLLVGGGQITGFALGAAGLAVLLLARGGVFAGSAALAALALKPQLAFVVGALVAMRGLRERRAALVAGAAVVLLPLIAVSLLVLPTWPGEWLHELTARRLGVAYLLPTAWGLAASVVGNTAWGAVAVLVVVAAIAALLAHRRVSDADLVAIGLPLSLFATPYAWSYDYLVLVVPWAAVLAYADRSTARTRWPLTIATLAVATLLPWSLYAVAFSRGDEALTAVVPALTALLVALAIRLRPPRPPLERFR